LCWIAIVRPLIDLGSVLNDPLDCLALAGKTINPPFVAMRVSDDHMPARSLLVGKGLNYGFLVTVCQGDDIRLSPLRGAATLCCTRPPVELQSLVEIGADGLHQRVDFAVKEMIGAGNDFLLDHDAFLRLELLD
jgi:hypothetical protein